MSLERRAGSKTRDMKSNGAAFPTHRTVESMTNSITRGVKGSQNSAQTCYKYGTAHVSYRSP